MKKRLFLLPMAVSVAALMSAAPDITQAKTSDGVVSPRVMMETGAAQPNPVQELLLKRAGTTGVKLAQHGSHYSHESHSSHVSHVSHASHSSGY